MTNGRGMMKFNRGFMRFSEGLPVVPVALRATLPWGIATHTLTSSILSNMFWYGTFTHALTVFSWTPGRQFHLMTGISARISVSFKHSDLSYVACEGLLISPLGSVAFCTTNNKMGHEL